VPQLEQRIIALEAACLQLLEESPAGLAEFALLQQLRRPPHSLLPELKATDSLGLFQSHFLLFHALYRLRDRLWREGRAELVITPLAIRLYPYRPGTAALGPTDPLRDYYLDLGQLELTGEEEVAALLDGFWSRYAAADERLQALALLELSEPVDYDTIKRRYRRLVMAHHPDRGGDAERMQQLNEALAVLARYYR
jgi:DnaJ-domain-containing protein 1